MSRIVVVGGGAAGLELVTRLGRNFGLHNAHEINTHEIVLVEPSSHHYWKPRLHEIAAGTFDAELDAVSYLQHSACNGYHYVQAAMTGVHRATQTLRLRNDGGEESLRSMTTW